MISIVNRTSILSFAFLFMSFAATAASAQGWRTVSIDHDRQGRLISHKERSENGKFRVRSLNYHQRNNVVARDRTVVFNADGDRTYELTETRDEQGRRTSILNLSFRNGQATSASAKQSWKYENDRDRRGRQINERYNPSTRQWTRFG